MKCSNCKVRDIDIIFYKNKNNKCLEENKSKFCSDACSYKYWEKLRRYIRKEFELRQKEME